MNWTFSKLAAGCASIVYSSIPLNRCNRYALSVSGTAVADESLDRQTDGSIRCVARWQR
jgi:hypothetical protein